MQDERFWATMCHLSALLMCVCPILQIVAPLVIWLMKREESAFVDAHGKEAINFQISMTIYALIAAVTIFLCIGLLLVPAVIVVDVIFTIIAAITANKGDYYRYPLSIRLIK